jgi:hypothetical protein
MTTKGLNDASPDSPSISQTLRFRRLALKLPDAEDTNWTRLVQADGIDFPTGPERTWRHRAMIMFLRIGNFWRRLSSFFNMRYKDLRQ